MSDKNNGRSFVFYETYLNSIEELEDEELELEVFRLISHYGIEGVIINDVSKTAKSIFRAHQFNIDKSLERRKIAIENGLKGGAPIGNDNAKKDKTTENNQNQPNNNQSERQNNLNVNANANVDANVNDNANGDVNLNKDIYVNEDDNLNGIIKGKNIRTLTTRDMYRIANKLNINSDVVQSMYAELERNKFITSNGEVIETENGFIKILKETIEYEQSNY